jgi:hypothetical protein
MADKKLLAKRSLCLVQVLEPKAYGQKGKSLLPFTAKDLSLEHGGPLVDKHLRFVAFNQVLQDFVKTLKPDEIFKVDYEEQEREGQPDYPPDRTVVQIYKADGTPVLVNPQGFNKGGFQGRSPESIRLEYSLKAQIENQERISIEGQTAINQIGLVLFNPAHDKMPQSFIQLNEAERTRLIEKYWKAVEKALDAYLAAKPLEIKAPPPAAVPANTPGKAQDGQGKDQKPAAVSSVTTPPDAPPAANEPPVFENIGKLLTAAGKLKPPVTRAELLQVYKVTDPAQIKDLGDAWRKVQDISKAKLSSERSRKTAADGKTAEESWAELNR